MVRPAGRPRWFAACLYLLIIRALGSTRTRIIVTHLIRTLLVDEFVADSPKALPEQYWQGYSEHTDHRRSVSVFDDDESGKDVIEQADRIIGYGNIR